MFGRDGVQSAGMAAGRRGRLRRGMSREIKIGSEIKMKKSGEEGTGRRLTSGSCRWNVTGARDSLTIINF